MPVATSFSFRSTGKEGANSRGGLHKRSCEATPLQVSAIIDGDRDRIPPGRIPWMILVVVVHRPATR